MFADDPVIRVSDRILPVQVFVRDFVVKIFDRSTWLTRSWEPDVDAKVWFTNARIRG